MLDDTPERATRPTGISSPWKKDSGECVTAVYQCHQRSTMHDIQSDSNVRPADLASVAGFASASPRRSLTNAKEVLRLDPIDGVEDCSSRAQSYGDQGSAPVPGSARRQPQPRSLGCVRLIFCGSSSLLVRTALWDLVGGLDEQFILSITSMSTLRLR